MRIQPQNPWTNSWILLLLTIHGISAAAWTAAGTPPRIIQNPSDLLVPKNEAATLVCKADGYPPPQINWYKNQGELISSSLANHNELLAGVQTNAENANDQSPRIIQQNGSLHFQRVLHNKKDKNDAGTYWCVAVNQYGEARSQNATLQIAYLRDEFRRQPNASLRVTTGSSALLECHPPRGHPIPKIYWKRDGKELKPFGRFAMMDEGNLVIRDVRPSDAGQYVCVAENFAAVKESHAVSLYVYSRPSITLGPEDVTAIAGDNIAFECKVNGDPLPSVTWHKKDSRRSFVDSRFELKDDGGLRINRVTAADEGTYVCQADNDIGSVVETAVLTIHNRPRILMAPRDQKIVLGGTVNFDCHTSGNPSPAVFWTKEGSQILMFPGQPHGRFSVQSDGTLIITGVQNEDAGNYVCSALSVAGSALEKAALEVTRSAISPPPVIVVGPSNQTLAINAVATLPCRSSGIPSPAVHWLKDDAPLSVNNFARVTILPSGTLQISDLRASDSGVYTCMVSSENGRTTWSAGLVVESPTNSHVVFHRMPDISALPGSPSKPTLENVTDAAIEISWRPAGTTDEFLSIGRLYRVEYFCFEDPQGWKWANYPTNLNRFTVSFLKPDHSYIFLVRAIASHGIVSQPSPLSDKITTLRSSPQTEQDFDIREVRSRFSQNLVELTNIQAISPTAISVQWKTGQDKKFITGYNVKYRENGSPNANYSTTTFYRGSSSGYTLFGLKKYVEYEIRLVPYYKDILGKDSNALLMRTLSDVPDEPPQDVKVTLIDPTTLSVSWNPPSPSHINGQLVGYRISIMPTGERPVIGSANASLTTGLVRNISVSHTDIRNEVVGNLTAGMRYRVMISAYTSQGVGVSSRPLYIKMERIAAGVPELLQQPWFIGVLCGILMLLLLAVLILFFLQWRKKILQLKKPSDYSPPTSTAVVEKVFHYHPQISSSESGSLLPNSIVGLPFVPASSGLLLSHQLSGNHCCNHGWVKHACDRTHSHGSGQSQQLPDSCPVHGNFSYGSMVRANAGSKPPAYSEVTERFARLETGESSLSSRRSHNDTVSVHSRRSSVDNDDVAAVRRPSHPVPNWADLLPPPPKGPPSPPLSERQRSPSRRSGSLVDECSRQEHELARRMADSRKRFQMELDDLEQHGFTRQRPTPYMGYLQEPYGGERRVRYHASLDRPFRNQARLTESQFSSKQYFAHRLAHNLSRTRSCESSINNDDEYQSDGSSDNETTDVQFIDANNGETSPCLSSEASFFLEKNTIYSNQNMPPSPGLVPDGGARPVGRGFKSPPHLQRIIAAEKFRQPLSLLRNSPRSYFMEHETQDSPDTPTHPDQSVMRISGRPANDESGNRYVVKKSKSRSRLPRTSRIRQVSTGRKKYTPQPRCNNSDPGEAVC